MCNNTKYNEKIIDDISSKLIFKTINYFDADVKRINHFIKVHSFARIIGMCENIQGFERAALELTAIVHDIGIKVSEAKYGSAAGKYQELEGPGAAKPILKSLDLDEDMINRILFLIAHHHTYKDVTGLDYQILLEADFIVNAGEDNLCCESITAGMNKFFKTASGINILKSLYL